MLLALCLYALRFVIWAAFPVPAVIVASQVLLGLTYGAVLVASVDFAARHAPAGLATTSQALTTGVMSGLGRSVGGVVAGSMYDGAGPRITFAVFGALTVIASVAFGVTWRRQGLDDRTAPTPGRRE